MKRAFNSSRARLWQENAAFAAAIPPGALVLDAGAGSAPYKSLFAHTHYESADFEQLKKPYAAQTYTCDLSAIPVEGGRFDAIVFNQVMEHLPEPFEVLRELHRVLKPGGCMIYSAPLFYEEHEQPFDFYRYTQFGVRHLFGKAGFELERLDWLEGYFGTLAYQCATAARTLPRHPRFFGGGMVGVLAAAMATCTPPGIRHSGSFAAAARDATQAYEHRLSEKLRRHRTEADMNVSLIVCTRNRASRLAEFFERISLIESPPGGWELILVDNASTDDTSSRIRAFAATTPFPVRSARAPIAGLGRARNVGIAHACGRILAFTDDDCYPRPDYLRMLVEVFGQHRVGFVGGRVVLYDPTDARVSIRDAEAAIDIEPRSFLPAGVMQGANMAVLREVVQAIGGFDPRLGAGTPCVGGEDLEFVARAAWAGWAGRFDPRPVVAHHHGRKPGADAERQQRGYDYARGAYYASFLLDRRSRATYLRRWYQLARGRLFRRSGLARLGRELAGGARYVIPHLVRPEAVPRFADTSSEGPLRGELEVHVR